MGLTSTARTKLRRTLSAVSNKHSVTVKSETLLLRELASVLQGLYLKTLPNGTVELGFEGSKIDYARNTDDATTKLNRVVSHAFDMLSQNPSSYASRRKQVSSTVKANVRFIGPVGLIPFSSYRFQYGNDKTPRPGEEVEIVGPKGGLRYRYHIVGVNTVGDLMTVRVKMRVKGLMHKKFSATVTPPGVTLWNKAKAFRSQLLGADNVPYQARDAIDTLAVYSERLAYLHDKYQNSAPQMVSGVKQMLPHLTQGIAQLAATYEELPDISLQTQGSELVELGKKFVQAINTWMRNPVP
jgi:hypothetical protein